MQPQLQVRSESDLRKAPAVMRQLTQLNRCFYGIASGSFQTLSPIGDPQQATGVGATIRPGTGPGKFDSAAGTADHSSFSFHPPDLFLGGGGTYFSFMLHAKRLRLGNRHLFNGTHATAQIILGFLIKAKKEIAAAQTSQTIVHDFLILARLTIRLSYVRLGSHARHSTGNPQHGRVVVVIRVTSDSFDPRRRYQLAHRHLLETGSTPLLKSFGTALTEDYSSRE
ncbi:hypothetical protein B0H14DRAFT_2624176 [Mycena olivaceomarginata]|nr:hypothetical protein B0H14DRAFT_2624176 [Mycena olivaceomarginata]